MRLLPGATTFAVSALLTPLFVAAVPRGDQYFTITVVDEETGRGVPLVELRTVNDVRYYTDSHGVVAFHEPGLMNQRVFFHVKGHGYEFPKDGFGYRGKALDAAEGGSARLTVKRVNLAERLYRVTGGGIYRDSLLVGRNVPLKQPALNGQVFGSDSVVNAVYRGKVYWFWGDTNRPAYPLGNFNVPGATSALPADGGLDPEAGVDLAYFLDDKGFAKAMAPVPGQGPTWINGLVALGDPSVKERLFAAYVKVRGVLEVYERGLVEFNDGKEQFEKVAQFDMAAPAHPGGHPFVGRQNGVDHVYFADPYPLLRVRADPDHLRDLGRYEAFTCLAEGSKADEQRVDRAPDGSPRYGWKRNTPPLTPPLQARLVKAGKLKADEALLHLQDADTGKPVIAHGGSVCINAYRGRWVLIAVESGGTSYLGEVWYAEADTPLGPWVYARKVVTHEKYSFYNPKQHPMFDKDRGRVIFFEGTYTHTFSGNPESTPRYDYNQIMYKLDLSRPELALPVTVYRLSEGTFATAAGLEAGREAPPVAFFALDRPGKGTQPVYAVPGQGLKVAAQPSSVVAFHALPADAKDPPKTTVPLYEYVSEDGKQRAYSTDASGSRPGYRRAEKPLCLVWKNPMTVWLPRN
jgi:hypothetical protein